MAATIWWPSGAQASAGDASEIRIRTGANDRTRMTGT
jgi:hypothetical protein